MMYIFTAATFGIRFQSQVFFPSLFISLWDLKAKICFHHRLNYTIVMEQYNQSYIYLN